MQTILVGLIKLIGLALLAPVMIAGAIISGLKSNRARIERRDDRQFKNDQRELTKLQLDRERRQAMEDKRS